MKKKSRVEVVDVLRGFAIMGIIILHSIEHFNFYRFPPEIPFEWMKFTDKAIWDGLFFAFGGKAYAIFALLFGFSFYIQDDNEKKRGHDFRLRFLWRLVILFLLGQFNAAFFTAEILTMYAMVGIILPLCCRLNNKILITLAIILLLQPMEWIKVIYAVINPDYISPAGVNYWAVTYKAQCEASFWEMVKVNLYEGQLASLTWAWEHGRIFQTAGLFLTGLWLGRTKLFIYSKEHNLAWHKYLLVAFILFFPLNGLHGMMPDFIANKEILRPFQLIIKSYANLCFMTVLVVMVLMVYYYSVKKKWLLRLVPYGRMSLTNYISQSIIGSLFFYNWGFNLNIGITYSALFGVALFLLQLTFCTVWLKHFTHGPFEALWKRLTWLGSNR
ncbi:MAG: DUF418 domain-containing protein [Tannerella sp.]|nr:DUF418 domain-containing protein [Tannerella sp.]